MKNFTLLILLLIGAYSASAQATRTFKLANILQSNMVIQQAKPFKLWGWAPAGDTITIKADWASKPVASIINAQAKWDAVIKVPKAIPGNFDTHAITVIHKKDTLRLTNLLIGEVWVCSGQSNMEMAFLTWNKIKNYATEIAAANYPDIRLLQVEHFASSNPQDEATGTWQVCTPKSIVDFSAIAYFFGREIYLHEHIPVGLVHTSWGGSVAQDWASAAALKAMPFFAKKLSEQATIPETRPQSLETANHPSVLFNGMIYPFLPLSIRGVIWYQGESNSNRSYQYRELFPLMINDWRKNWRQGDFPFYYVQLANLNFGAVNDVPKESGWAELREAQLMTLSLPNTGMAVTDDIGNPNDIHYANKQEAGRRLALIARAKAYGEHITYSGPIFKSMKIKHGVARLSFYYADGLKARGDSTLKNFAMAGADKKFYWADARIVKNNIYVSCPQVPNPIAVRYAWANNPNCNIYNGAGLPASPFRTDDWPGVTAGLN